jgi:hypothetical protein
VGRLYNKCLKLSGTHLSFKDNMSFISILSTQLLADMYLDKFEIPEPLKRESFSVWHDFSQTTSV